MHSCLEVHGPNEEVLVIKQKPTEILYTNMHVDENCIIKHYYLILSLLEIIVLTYLLYHFMQSQTAYNSSHSRIYFSALHLLDSKQMMDDFCLLVGKHYENNLIVCNFKS